MAINPIHSSTSGISGANDFTTPKQDVFEVKPFSQTSAKCDKLFAIMPVMKIAQHESKETGQLNKMRREAIRQLHRYAASAEIKIAGVIKTMENK